MKWLLLGLGGALGTVLRYRVSAACADGAFLGRGLSWYPLGTFLANVCGSFLLAWLVLATGNRHVPGTAVPWALVLGTGVMGGFTTYSTFNLESLQLLVSGHFGRAAGYVALTVLSCLLGGWLGIQLGRA